MLISFFSVFGGYITRYVKSFGLFFKHFYFALTDNSEILKTIFVSLFVDFVHGYLRAISIFPSLHT